MRKPFNSAGLIVSRGDDGVHRSLGTCFAYRTSNWLVTAAHVVRSRDVSRLGIALFLNRPIEDDEGLPVRGIAFHPAADLALVRVDADLRGALQVFDPFLGVSHTWNLGDEVRVFGFPTQSAEHGQELIPRMLRGSIQRSFQHQSPYDYGYRALELSVPAPAGMSGSPVSLDEDPSRVVGVLAEDYQSSTVLHTISEVEEDGTRFVERAHAVVNFGIAVEIGVLEDWLGSEMSD